MNWKKSVDSGEDGFYSWYPDEKVPVQLPYGEIEVDLISETDDIHRFDLQAVEAILGNADEYLTRAIDYIKDCIRKSPEQFRLTEEEMDHYRKLSGENLYIQLPDNNVEQYLSFSVADFPVSMPNMVFYPDKTWMIRFVESGLPTVCYGHGIGIFFDEKNNIWSLEIFPEE